MMVTVITGDYGNGMVGLLLFNLDNKLIRRVYPGVCESY